MVEERFVDEVRRKTLEVFPEKERHLDIYIPESKVRYSYFPALWYAETGLIDRELVTNLQRGKTLLSVGSGQDCHLERLLVNGFQINPKDITLSDITPKAKVRSEEMPYFQFDMTQPWPNELGKFDYILFPESLGVATMNFGPPFSLEFGEITQAIADSFLKGRDISRGDLNLFYALMESDVPKAKRILDILENASTHLKSDGEIRIETDFIKSNPEISTYLLSKLNLKYNVNTSRGRLKRD